MVTFDGKRVSRRWRRVLRAARRDGVQFLLTSGRRTLREQAALFKQNMISIGVPKPGKPLTAFPSPNAPHIRVGRKNHAIDVNALDGGEARLQRWLEQNGCTVTNPVPGEAWHMEITGGLRRLSRQIRRENRKPKPQPAKGIDVSVHQGTVDFAKVKQAGFSFVWIKATEGQGFVDAKFHDNVRAARRARMIPGGYHFLRPKRGRTGAQEVRDFIAALNTAGLGKGDLRPVLDVESTVLGASDTHAYVRSALKEMRRHGHRPVFYTFPTFLSAQWPDDFNELADLWIAHFNVATPTLPAPWDSFVAHQHSSTGRVPGVSGNVDLNRAPDLRRLIA